MILVVGAQKIVKDVEEGLKRIRDHALPKEDARMRSLGAKGSFIGQILILERLGMPNRKITVVFVKEALGF